MGDLTDAEKDHILQHQTVPPNNMRGPCSSSDDDEQDDHARQISDISDDDKDGSDVDTDPRLVSGGQPYNDTQEPPQPSTAGLSTRQRFLMNYGPKAYILR